MGLEQTVVGTLQPLFDGLVTDVNEWPRAVQRLRIVDFTLDHEVRQDLTCGQQ